MIYTITLNPCLDYNININNFTIGKTNISQAESIYPGGKGINVSMMLSNLGVQSKIFAFKAGFTGNYIESMLKEKNIDAEFINIKVGHSRINIKVKDRNFETELNSNGPDVTKEDLKLLVKKLDNVISGDVVVISGSIPVGTPSNIYEIICKKLRQKNALIVVDARGQLLNKTLKFSPFLIKPNIRELEELFEVKINRTAEVIYYASKLKNQGALNVLVSAGEKGAILLSESGTVIAGKAPKIKLVNSVGAGDSMVAGFIASYLKDKDYEKAFKLGIACGSATAGSQWLGESHFVVDLYKKIIVSP